MPIGRTIDFRAKADKVGCLHFTYGNLCWLLLLLKPALLFDSCQFENLSHRWLVHCTFSLCYVMVQ